MKTHKFIFVLLLGILFISCNSQSPALFDSQKAEAEKQIREISMKWLEFHNNRDIEGIKSLLAEDVVFYRSNQQPVAGQAAIQESSLKDFDQNPKQIADWKTKKVEVAAAGDYAIEYGSYFLKNLGVNGDLDDYGVYTTVYQNVNGKWKVHTDIGTSTKAQSQKADVEKQIREISIKWLELWNKRDIEGLKMLFADDAVVYRLNTPPSVGPVAIGETYAKEFKQNPKLVSDWKTDKVEFTAAGDYAFEYGSFRDKGLGSQGTNETYGKYVTLYRNVNGTWKVYTDIGSVTKPAN